MFSLRHVSIKYKILLLNLFITFLGVILLGGVGYWSGQRIIKESVTSRLAAIRDLKIDQIRSYYDHLSQQSQQLATNPFVLDALQAFSQTQSELRQSMPAADLGPLRKDLARHYEIVYGKGSSVLPPEDLVSIRLQAKYTALSPNVPNSDGYDAALQKYGEFLQQTAKRQNIEDLMLVDVASQRIVYSSANSALMGRIISDPLIKGTVLSNLLTKVEGKGYWRLPSTTDIVPFAASGGESNWFLSVGIFRDRKMVGLVLMQLNSKDIDTIMDNGRDWDQMGLGETGEAYAVGNDYLLRTNSRGFEENRDGFIQHLSKTNAAQKTLEKLEKATSTANILQVEWIAHQSGDAPNGCSLGTSYLGERVLSCSAGVRALDADWNIVVDQGSNEAYAPLKRFQLAVFLGALLLIIVCVWLSYRVSRQIVKPIEQLTQIAHSYGQGQDHVRVPDLADDELGELGETMNRMIENLEHVQEEGRFLRKNIVHDLKNPLAVIKGSSETLLQPEIGKNSAMRKELLANIVEQSDRLLDDLKDILEPIDESWKPDKEEFDLARVIQLCVQGEQRTVRAADHNFVVEGCDEPCIYFGDMRKIRRVIENFLSNAVKYSPGEGKTVTVRLQHGRAESVIEFEDQGLGMSQQDLDRVLNEGGRAVDNRMGIEGTGIGLQSCRRVLQAHGGRLEAHSQPSVGTTFRCVLPN